MKSLLKVICFVAMFNLPASPMGQLEMGRFDYQGYSRDYVVVLPQNFQPNMTLGWPVGCITTDWLPGSMWIQRNLCCSNSIV